MTFAIIVFILGSTIILGVTAATTGLHDQITVVEPER